MLRIDDSDFEEIVSTLNEANAALREALVKIDYRDKQIEQLNKQIEFLQNQNSLLIAQLSNPSGQSIHIGLTQTADPLTTTHTSPQFK